MAERVPITEEQLDALRREAAQKGRVQAIGIVPSSSPFPQTASASYHGNAVLKPPTWTWQVPLYFFVGGGSGISAVIALVAHIVGNAGVTRAASWVGFVGGLISAPLLVADLGRPARFLNMLRVFKPRSAMSMGAWTLVGFSSTVSLAVVCHELNLAGYGNNYIVLVEWLAEALAALSGLILASYTSVLLGVTAIPVWSENRKLVCAVFLAGALGSATAVLELLGFLISATQFMGIAASTAELIIVTVIELRDRYVDRPLREGRAGWLVRGGAVLAGPISFIIKDLSGPQSASPRNRCCVFCYRRFGHSLRVDCSGASLGARSAGALPNPTTRRAHRGDFELICLVCGFGIGTVRALRSAGRRKR